MTHAAIVDAITVTVDRYARLRSKMPPDKITPQIRPYYDLGVDSLDDLNIACEVEAILGVPLPRDQQLLVSGAKALSIEEAANAIARHLGVLNGV